MSERDVPEWVERATLALATDGLLVVPFGSVSSFWPLLATRLNLFVIPHPKRPGGDIAVPSEVEVALHVDLGRTPYRPEVVGLCVDRLDVAGCAYRVADSAAVRDVVVDLLPEQMRYSFHLPKSLLFPFRDAQRIADFAPTEYGQPLRISESAALVSVDFAVNVSQRSQMSGIRTAPVSLRGPYPGLPMEPDGRPLGTSLITELYDHLDGVQREIPIFGGQSLVLDNGRMLHGRAAWPGSRSAGSVLLGRFATPFG